MHYGTLAICRVPNTLPSVIHGKQLTACKELVCRMLHFGHTANILPSVFQGPRQNKVHRWKPHWTAYLSCAVMASHTVNTVYLPCALAQAHGKHILFAVCPGPCTRQTVAALPCALSLHTAKNGMFAVCPGPSTQQTMGFSLFF